MGRSGGRQQPAWTGAVLYGMSSPERCSGACLKARDACAYGPHANYGFAGKVQSTAALLGHVVDAL
eukprot:9906738-Alexandrium_andersonii.AAC.1